MMAPMRLVYLGSGEFGLPTLDALAGEHDVVAVVTQPDRPAGRGRALTPTPIASWAAGHLPGAVILKPERINEPEVVARLRGLGADAWVVIAFGQKLGRELLEGVLAINLHASLLPRWRGAAPINAAILAGDATTGSTVITLADRMDAGEILAQSSRPIEPNLTAGALHDLLASDGPALVRGVLEAHARGTLTRRPQDESLATRAPKLSKADSWVDFRQAAQVCRARIHGLTPWPGVNARLIAGQHIHDLKLTLVEVLPAGGGSAPVAPHDATAGTLADAPHGVVACGGGTALRLVAVKPSGKREMAWHEFIQGHRLPDGSRLDGMPAR